MDRNGKMLCGLEDLRSLSGLEIGPLHNPIVRSENGPITYVDHVDTESLRRKYADDPGVDVSGIVEIDAVWGEETLGEALGRDRRFDYVLASHVVEHVPDLVGWLNEVAEILRPGGTLRLAIPDRRFTFDIRRSETRLADVIEAYLLKARKPLPSHIVGFELHHLATDATAAWNGFRPPRLPDKARYAHCKAVLDHLMRSGEYWDVHCWVFTPLSFAELMEQLAALGLVRFSCDGWFDTERNSFEFITILREGGADPVGSWGRIAELLRTPGRTA